MANKPLIKLLGSSSSQIFQASQHYNVCTFTIKHLTELLGQQPTSFSRKSKPLYKRSHLCQNNLLNYWLSSLQDFQASPYFEIKDHTFIIEQLTELLGSSKLTKLSSRSTLRTKRSRLHNQTSYSIIGFVAYKFYKQANTSMQKITSLQLNNSHHYLFSSLQVVQACQHFEIKDQTFTIKQLTSLLGQQLISFSSKSTLQNKRSNLYN